MVTLIGKSLGARQQELNALVNSNSQNKINFDAFKHDVHKPDVDNMFKIDMACKQKNATYILEVFKTGDDFAITRILNKSPWLCDDAFARYINLEFLSYKIFPFMSMKMKQKLLNKISEHLKDQKRITEFYQWCLQEQWHQIAVKFLRMSSLSHKIDEATQSFCIISTDVKKNAHFIGNSFTLARMCFGCLTMSAERNIALTALRHLYSVSEDQYLDLLETFYDTSSKCNEKTQLGLRLSKSIMKKYKDRVLYNPSVYMNVLNPTMILKSSTYSDAEIYAVSVLPPDATTFWNSNYCITYKFILDLIPAVEKFSFVKKIFEEKYPNEQFEMSIQFYILQLYNLMTVKEKEDWALRHIANEPQLLGVGCDYIWFKFVIFDKAFEEIQKRISEATETEKRLELINVLIDSAQTPRDLEKLLKYYTEHYLQGSTNEIESFLNKLLDEKNVFKFNEDCWLALEKLFDKLEVFDKGDDSKKFDYRAVALLYNIINGKKVPDILHDFLDMGVTQFQTLSKYGCKMDAKETETVYQYVFKYYADKIKKLKAEKFSHNTKCDIYNILGHVVDWLTQNNKKKEDIPEMMFTLIRLNWEKFKYHKLFATQNKFDERNIRRCLKEDSALVLKEFPKIKDYVSRRFGNINWLLRKLRTYFPNDIAQVYVKNFENWLSNDKLNKHMAVVAVRGIITLADEAAKICFLERYAPTNTKSTNGTTVMNAILHIQRAICHQACYSRPLLPLSSVKAYITGEYIPYCMPLFQNYVRNLPQPLCLEFMELIIEKPTIRKQAIRAAFDCLKIEDLKSFVTTTWENTTDSKFRTTIYKDLLNKCFNGGSQQYELFEVLKKFTENLRDDDGELFNFMCNVSIPHKFTGHYLMAGLQAVNKLPEGDVNFQRKATIIRCIERDICSIPEKDLDKIINSHIHKMLHEKQILNSRESDFKDYVRANWDLTARSLTYVHTDPLLEKNLNLSKKIITECVEMWNAVQDDKYVVREFCVTFLNDVDCYSYDHNVYYYGNTNILFSSIIEQLKSSLPERDIYMLIWTLRLGVTTRKLLAEREQYEITDDYNILQQQVCTSITNSIMTFAENLAGLMQEYIIKNEYFSSFDSQIESLVMERIETIKNCLDSTEIFNLTAVDLQVILCKVLVNNAREFPLISLFALKMLPETYDDTFTKEYKDVLRTIKSFENNEVQYFLYDKFINNGFRNLIDDL